MATTTITIHYKDEEVLVTLKSAKKIDGIRRANLMTEAVKRPQTDPLSMTAFFLHPTCVCSVLEPEWLRDVSVEDFATFIDEADIDVWVSQAYLCNEHWRTGMQTIAKMGEDDEKKSGTLLTGSVPPTEMSRAEAISQPLKN